MAPDTSIPEIHESADSPPGSSPSRKGQNEEGEISLLDLLIVLAERKRLVLWVTAAFAVLAIVISLILPKIYTATVTLLPPQQNSSMGAALTSQLGNLGGMAALAGGSVSLKNPNDMYVAMFKSRTVEDAMVQHFNLMEEYRQKYASDACTAFEHHVKIDGSGKDNMIHISVDDRDPNRAAQLANGYVDQYRYLSEHLAITEAAQRRLFFEQQLKQAKDNLAIAEEAMKATEQKTGMIQLDSQARALIESASSLRAQVAAKEVQIESMRTFATSENPQLVQAQQELDSLRAQLAKLGGNEAGSDSSLMVPKGQVPQASLEYIRRLRDVKYYETIFDILARQFEIAKLDEARQGAVIQVLDAAVPPDRHSFPKRGLIVIISTVLGFFLGILAALLHAGFQHMKQDVGAGEKLHAFLSALSFRARSS